MPVHRCNFVPRCRRKRLREGVCDGNPEGSGGEGTAERDIGGGLGEREPRDQRQESREEGGTETRRTEGWGLEVDKRRLVAAAVRQRGGTKDEWSRGGLVGIGKVFSLYMLIPTVLRTKMGFLAL